MRPFPLVLLAGVLALAVASCGDDGGGGDHAGTGGTVGVQADAKAAKRAVTAYTAAMKSNGFTESTRDEDGTKLAFTSERCKKYEKAFGESDDLPGQTAQEQAPDLERADQEHAADEQLSASVGFTRTVDDLDGLFALLRRNDLVSCVEEALKGGFDAAAEDGAQVELTGVQSSKEDVRLGDEAIAIRIAGSLGAADSGTSLGVVVRLVFARAGRAAVVVSDVAVGPPSHPADTTELARYLIGQLA